MAMHAGKLDQLVAGCEFIFDKRFDNRSSICIFDIL